jgi:nuclear pore complex protein Nup160
MDYEQFRSASEIHWRRFYRLLVELDKRRSEAVSLVLDSAADTAWVVCADFVSAIRECSQLEKLYHNLSRPEGSQKDVAKLVSTALSFLDVLPDNIMQICTAVLRPELFEDTTKTDLERIQYFSDKAGFWRGVTEEDCIPVVENLGQNFNLVTLDLYNQILDLVAPDASTNRNIRHPLTDFGRKLVVKAVQDNLALQWKVCFSQLILLVHMEFEFEQEEDALHHRVDIGTVFRRLVDVLRRLELLRWLSKAEISVPLRMERGGASSPVALKRGNDEMQTITALEGSVGHLLGFGDVKREPLASSLTDIVASLCSPESDIELSPAHIQCFLVKRDRADLAAELIPFSDRTPFATYVQGRVFLALRDYSSASIYFKKAAIGLSK